MLVQQESLVQVLSPPLRKRYRALLSKVARTGDLFNDDFSAARPGEFLAWIYLKHLLALDHLLELSGQRDHGEFEARRAAIEAALIDDAISEQSRNTKLETLNLLDQHILAGRQSLMRIEESESELLRIELRLSLLHERAAQSASVGESLRAEIYSEAVTLAVMPPGFGNAVRELDLFFAAAGEY